MTGNVVIFSPVDMVYKCVFALNLYFLGWSKVKEIINILVITQLICFSNVFL